MIASPMGGVISYYNQFKTDNRSYDFSQFSCTVQNMSAQALEAGGNCPLNPSNLYKFGWKTEAFRLFAHKIRVPGWDNLGDNNAGLPKFGTSVLMCMST